MHKVIIDSDSIPLDIIHEIDSLLDGISGKSLSDQLLSDQSLSDQSIKYSERDLGTSYDLTIEKYGSKVSRGNWIRIDEYRDDLEKPRNRYTVNNYAKLSDIEISDGLKEILKNLENTSGNKYRFIINQDNKELFIGSYPDRKKFRIYDCNEECSCLEGTYPTYDDLRKRLEDFYNSDTRKGFIPGWNYLALDFPTGTLCQPILDSGLEGDEHEIYGFLDFE